MDITIRSVDEVCGVSGGAFVPGSLVRSYLFRNEEGLIDRVDILEDQRENLPMDPAAVICSWRHRIREKQTTEAEERRASLQSAEDVFLSLFDEGDGEDDPMMLETRDRLKFFLALQLERKRILKPLGGRKYRHVASKRELHVPDIDINADLLKQFQEEIALMGNG